MLISNAALKPLIALLLALPVGGYAVGSLAASSADEDTPRQTIRLEEAGPTPAAPADRERPQRPARHHRPTSKPADLAATGGSGRPTDLGEADEDGDGSSATDSGQVETIVPRYHESGESEDPAIDEGVTTATDDGDAQGDDASGEPDSDRRGDDSGDDSDQDGGGD